MLGSLYLVCGALCFVRSSPSLVLSYECLILGLLYVVHASFFKIFYEAANFRSGLTSKRINVVKLDLGDVPLVKSNVEL